MTPSHPHTITRRALLKSAAALAAAGPVSVRGQSTPPATPSPDTSIPQLIAGNTTFAFDVYAELRSAADGNLVFSPYSVSQALAMTWAGAEGATASQMADALAFTLEPPVLNEAFGALNADLIARANTTAASDTADARTLNIANGLWGEQAYPFSTAYIAELERTYGTGLQEVEFQDAPEMSRGEINDWVEAQTGGHIQDIIPPGAITSDTRMVLANALYFSGPWASSFDPDHTYDDTFFLLDGTTETVAFMVQLESLNYAQLPGLTVVELPYESSGFTLTAILPDAGLFEQVEAGLDAKAFVGAVEQLAEAEVEVYVPRFEFTYDLGGQLNTALSAMGMVDAFDKKRADFCGMIDSVEMMKRTPPERLYIDEVRHKAYIGVEEHRTEAAAATTVEMGGTPMAMPPNGTEPIEVRIDRPFLFAIRDTVTGTVLFLGRVLDPTA